MRRGRGNLLTARLDTRDIDNLTVGELAVLFREHAGSPGQGFELAMIDAINSGYGPVVDALQDALESINVPMSRPRAVAMGLEKIVEPEPFIQRVSEVLEGHRLVTGNRGRPAKVPNALRTLLSEGTRITHERGDLAVSDFLLYDEDDGGSGTAVTGSIKINHRFQVPPNPPRIWIVGGSLMRWPVRRELPATCAVAWIRSPTLSVFNSAYDQVRDALRALDLNYSGSRFPGVVSKVVYANRHKPVAKTVEELYDRAHSVFNAYFLEVSVPVPAERTLEVPMIDLPDKFGAFRSEQTDSGLSVLMAPLTPSRQFFTDPRVRGGNPSDSRQ